MTNHAKQIRDAMPVIAVGFWILASLLLAGCATPYDPPHVVEPTVMSLGQREKERARPFDGILDFAEQGDVRVVWVHGMCTQTREWADVRHRVLSVATRPASSESTVEGHPGGPFRVLYRDRVHGNELEARYLIWSPLTQSHKKPLKSVLAENPYKAARLNKSLKNKLFGDCLSDAVVYTGAAGDPTRTWMKQQVCHALGGTVRASGMCVFTASHDRRQVVFVAESLGSKLLSDAILAIWKQPGDKGAFLDRLNRDVQTVFLVANQIPLLSTAEVSDARLAGRSTAAQDMFDVFRLAELDNKDSDPRGRLRIVEFTDPSDIFSYRLVPGINYDRDRSVTNVVVSNSNTYFGAVADPLFAHCGYGRNSAVLGLVMLGYDGQTIPRIDAGKAGDDVCSS